MQFKKLKYFFIKDLILIMIYLNKKKHVYCGILYIYSVFWNYYSYFVLYFCNRNNASIQLDKIKDIIFKGK